jgi:LPS export ABC transporter protein LptC
LTCACLAGTLPSPDRPLLAAEAPAPPATIAPEKQGEMEKVRLTEIQDGVKKWILTADSADYLKDKDRIYVKNIRVDVFGQNQDHTKDNILITGDSGFIGVKSRDLTLEGNVQAKTGEYEITSDLVHYNPQTRVLAAPGPVKVQGPRLVMEGTGMTVDLRNNKLEVAQHKVTKLRVPGKLWNY